MDTAESSKEANSEGIEESVINLDDEDINKTEVVIEIEKEDRKEDEENEAVNIVEEIQKPNVNMKFKSIDDVMQYYKEYSMQVGFPISKRSSEKGKDGELKYVTFACARGGTFKSQSSNPLKPRPTKKTQCQALIRVSKCLDGEWKINSLKLDHNHDLSPRKTRYYHGSRNISADVKKRLEVNDVAGIRLNKSFNSFVVEAQGIENMSFMEKDARNHIEKVRRLRLKEGDATAVQTYFRSMQAKNDKFFYAIDLDEKGRLKILFWADPRSRAAYMEFGDVVTFDTTYLTNKYDMSFAPFVGVNHHGQSILLGCGLIASENTESFIWLFSSWLTCMYDKAPDGIITDQDRAMKNAIESVLPNTRHRWCLWHIMRKIPEKLKGYTEYESIRNCLHTTVYDSLTRAEFEECWSQMIETYGLTGNPWLSGLYEERNRWVPCFVKNEFWAGMSTTQRSESMNSFFDGHVNSKTTLKQFVGQYENALRAKVEKENIADFESSSYRLPLSTHYDMEIQVQEVYTRSKFKEFRDELTGKIYCDFISVNVDNGISEYQLSDEIKISEITKNGTFKLILTKIGTFKVVFNEADTEVMCNCSMFEFKGILCRHALYVLIRHKIKRIPDRYIIRRWRKDVERCHTRVKINCEEWSSTPEAQRCDKMQKRFDDIKELAQDSDDKCKIVIDWMIT